MPEKIELEKLWSEYQLAIKRFLQSKVENSADVDDLLQDILIKTYQNLSSIKAKRSIKSWLFQIARHSIADFYRQRARLTQLTADDLWYEQDTDEIKLGLCKCISPFLQSLPEENAELLNIIEIRGKSQKEYAKQLGISYSTLKSRVQKSRILLRQLFADCCVLTLAQQGNVVDCDVKSRSRVNC